MLTTIRIKTLPHYEGLELPAYGTAHAAGFDLLAAIDAPVTLKHMDHTMIPTGIAIALPDGFEMQVRARSGLARKNGIGLVNGVGTIDADYRGEVGVLIINYGKEDFVIERGMRIAQAVIAKYERIVWEPVLELEETERGVGGFGSTGV